jgi:AhpC/TSA family
VGAVPRLVALGLVLTGLVLVAAGCGGAEEETAPSPPAPATTAQPPAPDGGEEDGIRGAGGSSAGAPQSEGEPVPDITGPTLDGTSVSLSDYRGKKVILHVWSSW